MTDHRHFFVKDSDSNIVGKFDVGIESRQETIAENLPPDLSIDPIPIPDEASDRSEALDKLSSTSVDWDDRLIDI